MEREKYTLFPFHITYEPSKIWTQIDGGLELYQFLFYYDLKPSHKFLVSYGLTLKIYIPSISNTFIASYQQILKVVVAISKYSGCALIAYFDLKKYILNSN